MIVVKVELHSAVTGKVSSLGEVLIDNVGTTANGRRADYRARSFRKGVDVVATCARQGKLREGMVSGHARLSLPVQTLVRRALEALGY